MPGSRRRGPGKLAKAFPPKPDSVAAARSLHPGRIAFPALATLDGVASRLENTLKTLPAKPGVYLFRDKAGEVDLR